MAFKLAEAFVQLSRRGFAEVEGSVGRIKSGLGGMKSGVTAVNAAIGVFAASGAVRMFRDFVDAAAEAEKQTAKLGAVLKSTGGVSGQTVASLEAHASALQRVTAFEDDTIKGAQAVLLTFKKIGGETFPQATEAALDLATVFEGDLRSSAMMVGKALEDPIRGITALRRAGVSFTEDQKNVIKSLVDTGKTWEAQALILTEIHSQVGGSAKAVGETTFGAMEQIKNTFGDLAEVIGDVVTPAVRDFAKMVRFVTDNLPGARLARQAEGISGLQAIDRDLARAGNKEDARKLLAKRNSLILEAAAGGVDLNKYSGWVNSKSFRDRMNRLPDLSPEKNQAALEARNWNAMTARASAAGGMGEKFTKQLSRQLFSGGEGLLKKGAAALGSEANWLKDQLSSSLRQERLLQSIYERLAPEKEIAVFE